MSGDGVPDGDAFQALHEAVRAGRHNALKHFRKRAAERGFTVEQAVEVLTRDDVIAWHEHGGRLTWLVTQVPPSEPGHQVHVRARLTASGSVLLIAGWVGSPRRTLCR
jgi:hypothetical protein